MKNVFFKKVLLNVFIVILVISFGFNIYSEASVKDYINDFGNTRANGYDKLENTTMNMAGSIIVIARVITTSIAIIVLLVIAMKYMISAPGERADIKKHAVPYVIGSIILFGTSGILAIIGEVSKSIK